MVLSDRDRELLNRCLAGVDGAWDAFIDRYLPLITHVASTTAATRFGVVSRHVVEDMVAEILLALVDDDFAVLRRFRGQSSLGTYLVVVSRRIAARRVTKLSPEAIGKDVANPALAPTDDSESQFEDREEVESLLTRLDGSEATAIRLYHLEHLSYSDIGSQMGIPENSVGPLLSRARQRMRSLRE